MHWSLFITDDLKWKGRRKWICSLLTGLCSILLEDITSQRCLKGCLLLVNHTASHVRIHSSLRGLFKLISYRWTKSWQAHRHKISDGLPSFGPSHRGYQWQGNNRKWCDQSHCSTSLTTWKSPHGSAKLRSCWSATCITCDVTRLLCCHRETTLWPQIYYYFALPEVSQQLWRGVTLSSRHLHRTHDPPTSMHNYWKCRLLGVNRRTVTCRHVRAAAQTGP